MSQQRTWITREEIAQIYDARIKKIVTAISKDKLTVLQEMRAGSDVLRLQYQADTIRANDKIFSNPKGSRV